MTGSPKIQPGSTLRLDRLRASALAHQEPGVEIPKDDSALDVIAKASAGLPSKEEQRFMWTRLCQMIDGILDALPEGLAERGQLANPPLKIPSKVELMDSPAQIETLLKDLHKRVSWDLVAPAHKYEWRLFREQVGLLVKLCEDVALGKMNALSQDEYTVKLRAFDQLSRAVVLYGECFREAVKFIPVPELPEPPAEKGPERFGSAIMSRLVQVGLVATAGFKAALEGLGHVYSKYIRPVVKAVVSPVIEAGRNAINRAVKAVALVAGNVAGPALATGAVLLIGRAIWTNAGTVGIWLGVTAAVSAVVAAAAWYFEGRHDLRGGPAASRLKPSDSTSYVGGKSSGLGGWKRFAWTNFDWRKSLRESLVKSGLSNVSSYASIVSKDPEFENSPMVLNVLVPVDNSGTLRSLNELIPAKSSAAPGSTPTPAEVLFTERTFDENYPGSDPLPGQTFIRFPVLQGLHPYPFPPHFELVGVRLLSRKQELIDISTPVKARWGVFGGLELECPPDASFVEICLESRPNKPIPEDTLKTLENSLPDLDTFTGMQGKAARTALSAVNLPSDSAHELVLEHEYSRGLAMGRNVSAIANKLVASAGTSVNEMVGGLRRGSNEAVNLYFASLLRAHGAVAGLATVIPHSSDELHPSRSVQRLQRLTTDGPRWENVSKANIYPDDVVTPDLLQSMRIVGAVSSMPSEELYEYATQVDAVLSGRRSIDSLMGQLRGTVETFFWGRPAQKFQGDYKYAPFVSQSSFASAPEQLQGPLRAVSALTTAITFDHVAKQARRGDNVSSALRMLDANSAATLLSEEDRLLISESHRALGAFNPRHAGLALVGELLDTQGARGNRPACTEVWKWIGARLPNAYERGIHTYFREKLEWSKDNAERCREIREKGALGTTLSVDEAIALLSGNRIQTIPASFIEPFIHALTMLPIAEHGLASSPDNAARKINAEQLNSIKQILEATASRFVTEKVTIVEDSFRLILDRIAAISDWGDAVFSSDAQRERFRSELVGVVSKLGATVKGSSVAAFFDLIHTDRAEQRERVTRLFNGQDLARGLGFSSSAKDQRRAALESLSYSISESLTTAPLSAQDPDVWQNSLSCLARVGIKPAELPDRVRVLSIIRKDLKQMHKKDPTFINLPDDKNPASRLLAEMTQGAAVKALRVLGRLVEGELITNKELQSSWPSVDESKVAQLFWKLVDVNCSSRGLSLKISPSRIAPSEKSAIQVDRIPWLSQLLSRADSAALPLVYFNRDRLGVHWAEQDLQEVWERYPGYRPEVLSKSGLVSDLSKGAMAQLVEEFDRDSVYRAHAWLAACMSTESGRAAAVRAARLAELFRFGKQQQYIQRDLRALVESVDVGANSFGELSVELKTRMLLAGALVFSKDRHPLAARRTIKEKVPSIKTQPTSAVRDSTEGARKALSSAKGIPSRLLTALYAPKLPNRKLPSASVWTALYTEPAGFSIDVDSLLSLVRSRADLIRREFKDAWPRYLQSRIGRMVVPTTGGDIRELREYSFGDDFRRIVWSTSQRLGKLVVRTNEETESRNYTFVVDLDHLAQDFLEKKGSITVDVTKAPGLIDLMTALELVRHENLSANVVLYGRSFIKSIPDMVKTRKGASVGDFDQKALKELLLPGVCAAVSTLAAEDQISSDTEKQTVGVNPFESPDLKIDDSKRIHIFVGGQANKGFYRGALEAVVRRGIAAVSFIPKKKPTEEEDSQEVANES